MAWVSGALSMPGDAGPSFTGRTRLQAPNTMRGLIAGGEALGFVADATLTYNGTPYTIPGGAWFACDDGGVAMAMPAHYYVAYALVSNPATVRLVRQENWAAVYGAQDAIGLLYVTEHGEIYLPLGVAAITPVTTPYAALLLWSYAGLGGGGAFGDPWYGTLTNPVLNFPGLSTTSEPSPFALPRIPASGFTSIVSYNRTALAQNKHLLAIDGIGRLWALTNADAGGPGSQVAFPELLASPAQQYCLGVCRDGTNTCWWALIEESNALYGACYCAAANFVPVPSSGTITGIKIQGSPSPVAAFFSDGANPTVASGSITQTVAIKPDSNGDMVITADHSGVASATPGTVAPNDGTVALAWINVVGSTLTVKANLGGVKQRLPSDGAVGSPVPLRRSVAILKSTATLPSSAGDWTIAATLAPDAQPPIEDQFLGVGAGGAVLAYQMDATLGPVWVSTGLTHLSFYGVDGTQSTAVGPTVGGLEWGMAVVNGQAWITGGGTVSRYHSSGELIGSFFSRGFTRAMLQVGAVVWLAEYDANLIDVYTLAGVFVTTYSGNGLAGPNGLALVGDQVWVANATNGNTTISRFNLDGTAAGVLSDPSLSQPWSLCVAGDVVWVSNVGTRTISRFTMDGTFYDVISLNTLGPPAVQNLIAVGSQVWLTAGGSPGYGIYRFNFDGSFVGPALSDAHGGNPFTLCLVPGGGGIVTMSPPTIHSGHLTVVGGGVGAQPGISNSAAWVGGQYAHWLFQSSNPQIAVPTDGTYYLTLSHDVFMSLQAYTSLTAIPANEVLVYQVTISGGAISSYTPYLAGSWVYGTAAQFAANTPIPVAESYYGQLAIMTALNVSFTQGGVPVIFDPVSGAVGLGFVGALVNFVFPDTYANGGVIDPTGVLDTRLNLIAVCDDGAGGVYGLASSTNNSETVGDLWHRAGDSTHAWVQVTTGYGTGGTQPGPNGFICSGIFAPVGAGVVWVLNNDIFESAYLDVIAVPGGTVTYGTATTIPRVDFSQGGNGGTENEQARLLDETEFLTVAFPLP